MGSYIIGFVIGYVFCVLFPLPYVNRLILDFWSHFFTTEPAQPIGPSGPSGGTGPTGPTYSSPIFPP